jgi:hypothetical protein
MMAPRVKLILTSVWGTAWQREALNKLRPTTVAGLGPAVIQEPRASHHPGIRTWLAAWDFMSPLIDASCTGSLRRITGCIGADNRHGVTIA